MHQHTSTQARTRKHPQTLAHRAKVGTNGQQRKKPRKTTLKFKFIFSYSNLKFKLISKTNGTKSIHQGAMRLCSHGGQFQNLTMLCWCRFWPWWLRKAMQPHSYRIHQNAHSLESVLCTILGLKDCSSIWSHVSQISVVIFEWCSRRATFTQEAELNKMQLWFVDPYCENDCGYIFFVRKWFARKTNDIPTNAKLWTSEHQSICMINRQAASAQKHHGGGGEQSEETNSWAIFGTHLDGQWLVCKIG